MSRTLVLDLDDTLFPEADYVASGVRFVAARLALLYGVDAEQALLERAGRGEDWVGLACEIADLPESAKSSLLWIYRLHEPRIDLSGDTVQALDALRRECVAVVILTDGRSVTQRLKLSALGLNDLPAYISEEWQSEKPDLLRFEQIIQDWPADRYIYVADNVGKDFIAPNRLGWLTIGLRLGKSALYSSLEQPIDPDKEPVHWVRSLGEVLPLL